MSEFALYDFTESLNRVGLSGSEVTEVLYAWGNSPEGYGSWEGGFVLKLGNGRYAYVSGWCDTTGWGCQDGADIRYADSVEGLRLPNDLFLWDCRPADLNRWLAKGSPDPDDV